MPALMRLEHEIFIGLPVESVFEFISDSSNVTQWKKGLVAVRRKTSGPVGVGTIDTHISEFLGQRSEVDHEITTYEPDRLVKFRTLNAPFPSQGYFSFERHGEGTKVTIVSEAEPAGIYRFVAPLVRWIAMRQLVRDGAILKSVLENG